MRAGVVHRRIFWTAGGVGGRRQRSRQILDPAARALSFLVRRPRDVVQVDRRESLDRLVHLVGERSRDVLEAAAIRLVIAHRTIVAAPPALQCVNNAAGLSAGSESPSHRAGPHRWAARTAHRLPCSSSARQLGASAEAARGYVRELRSKAPIAARCRSSAPEVLHVARSSTQRPACRSAGHGRRSGRTALALSHLRSCASSVSD
jgi:hypothetical protein